MIKILHTIAMLGVTAAFALTTGWWQFLMLILWCLMLLRYIKVMTHD